MRNLVQLAIVLVGGGAGPVFAAQNLSARLEGDTIRVEAAGRLFTAYKFATTQKYPYFWPVNGPISNRSLTTETSEPYPHHHSLFFGCDRVNRFNFWQEGNERGQIVSCGPRILTSGPDRVEIEDRCEWKVPGREPLIEDVRRITISAPTERLRFIDWRITLRALQDVHVEETNHSLFSIRVMPHLSPKGAGRLTDSAGRSGEKETFGQKGPWVDFSGDNGGSIEGLAILDHPENPWFPAPWFTRDYGFASPTPMYWLSEEGWKLPRNGVLTLRYRVVAHAGDAGEADIHGLYRRWAGAEHVEVIPVAPAFAATPVNHGQALCSDGRRQYIAFYDPDRTLSVGARELGTRRWRFIRLDEKVGWDSHNRIAVALDREGCLHVCANHHVSDLNYYRTLRPGDIDSFEQVDRFGATRETRVTYPHFLHLPPDGRLGVMYRVGSSGEGDTVLLSYDEKTRSWSSVVPGGVLLKGTPQFNAYPVGVRADAKGRLHLAWCWRETPAVETNQDICYALSPDGGKTWHSSDGRRLETPITPETAEVVDPIPQNAGLMNAGHMAIDPQGRPWITYIRFGPNGGTQMYAAVRLTDGWRVLQLSDWAFRWDPRGTGSIPSAGIGCPSIEFGPGEEVRVVFSHAKYYWGAQVIRTSVEELLRMKPGAFEPAPYVNDLRRTGLDYSYAVLNDGPLPEGQQHWMVQKTAGNNRDREPSEKMPPTMVYLVVSRTLR